MAAQIAETCAPLSLKDKQITTGTYTPAQIVRIEEILNKNPLVLKMYGIDPDEARESIKQSKDALLKLEAIKKEDPSARKAKL